MAEALLGRVRTSMRVPYVIAYSEELVVDEIRFVLSPMGEYRLSYAPTKAGDWWGGVLRARARQHRRGQPQWRKVNPIRQWKCMVQLLCQVCGLTAIDPNGRIPWIMTETAFHPDRPGATSGVTSAPPTCWNCVPEALALCPQLHVSSAVYTVGEIQPVAVLADMYAPGFGGRVLHTGEHNVEVPLDAPHLLRRALANQLIVRVHDLRPEQIG